jgi:hypothetical protein
MFEEGAGRTNSNRAGRIRGEGRLTHVRPTSSREPDRSSAIARRRFEAVHGSVPSAGDVHGPCVRFVEEVPLQRTEPLKCPPIVPRETSRTAPHRSSSPTAHVSRGTVSGALPPHSGSNRAFHVKQSVALRPNAPLTPAFLTPQHTGGKRPRSFSASSTTAGARLRRGSRETLATLRDRHTRQGAASNLPARRRRREARRMRRLPRRPRPPLRRCSR